MLVANQTKSARIPELDGIRGMAILIVLAVHYINNELDASHGILVYRIKRLAGLWSGVDLFFVLSGFLIGGILWDHAAKPGFLRTFYTRRICRIFPLYFAVLIPYLILFRTRLATGWLFDQPMPAWSYILFLQNFYMAKIGTFGAHWLNVTWSLAVEEQFYLLLPIIFLALPRRGMLILLVAGTIASYIIRCQFVGVPNGEMKLFVLLPCRWDFLFLGMLGAYLARQSFAPKLVIPLRILILPLAAACLYIKYRQYDWLAWHASLMLSCFAAFYATLVLLVAISPDGWLRRAFRLKPLRQLGNIAFGIYLFHQIIAGIVHRVVNDSTPLLISPMGIVLTIVSAAITITLAWLSYTYFETPFIKLGHRVKYGPTMGLELTKVAQSVPAV